MALGVNAEDAYEGFNDIDKVLVVDSMATSYAESETANVVSFAWKYAIDLGHENVRIFLYPSKRVISAPSYAATNGKKFFKGFEAKSIIGRHPSDIHVISLIEDNTIRDYKVLYKYFNLLLRDKVKLRFYYQLLIGEMTKLKKVDVKFLYKVFRQLGFWKVYFVPQIIATAVGLDLDITKPHGYLILDVGAGTTKIGLVTLYGVSAFREIDSAGREMDKLIADYLSKNLQIMVGPRTAEELKKLALDLDYLIDYDKPEEYVIVKGIDSMSRLPVEREVPKSAIARAVESTLYSIVEEVKDLMATVSPELISDVLREGIYLTGGGSLIPGIDRYLSFKLGIKINNSHTNEATVRGLGKILSSDLFRKVSNLKDAKDLFQRIYV